MLLTEQSIITKASPEAVWKIWADVANWKSWDKEVEWSQIDAPFQKDTLGKLKPKGGPACKFVLVDVVPNRSFEDYTKLPLARLWFKHTLEIVAQGTKITHRVEFRGLLGWLFCKLIGKSIAESMPEVLKALSAQAEAIP